MNKTVSRKELYDLVWSVSLSDIAKQFEISERDLEKKCSIANVPMPPKEYWTKQQAGKKVLVIPLPTRKLGQSNNVSLGHMSWPFRDENVPQIVIEPVFDDDIESVAERVRKLTDKLKFVLPRTPQHPRIKHFLEVNDRFVARKKDDWSYKSFPTRPDFYSKFEQRRLRILDSLFYALQKIGVQPYIKSVIGRDLHVVVGDTTVEFTLDRKKEDWVSARQRSDSGYTSETDDDNLVLIIQRRQEWRDKPKCPLQSQLREVAFALVLQGELQCRDYSMHRYKIMLERREEIDQAERQRIIDEENSRFTEQRQNEQRCFENMIDQFTRHKKANEIRMWVDQVRDAVGEGSESPAFQSWRDWVLANANRLDPLNKPVKLEWPGSSAVEFPMCQ